MYNSIIMKLTKYSPTLKPKATNFENLATDLELALDTDNTSKYISSSIIKEDFVTINKLTFYKEINVIKDIKGGEKMLMN